MEFPSVSQRRTGQPGAQKLPLNGFTEWNFLGMKNKHVRIGNKSDWVEGIRLLLFNKSGSQNQWGRQTCFGRPRLLD